MKLRLPLLAILIAAAAATPFAAPAADLSRAVVLIAKRDLQDRLYGATIVVARPVGNRHVGLIINKPTQMTLGNLFPNHPPSRKVTQPVFLGGPVGPEVIFALVQRRESPGGRSLQIAPDLFLAVDSKIVDAIIESEPDRARFFAGMVLWMPGELAQEVKRGLWFVNDANAELVLRRKTDGLWEELVGRSERRANTI